MINLNNIVVYFIAYECMKLLVPFVYLTIFNNNKWLVMFHWFYLNIDVPNGLTFLKEKRNE